MPEEQKPNVLEMEPSDSPEYQEAMLAYAAELEKQNDPNSSYYNQDEPEETDDVPTDNPEGADGDAPAAPVVPPDYIPEKFRKAKDPIKAMAAAYAALEAKLGSKQPAKEPEKDGKEPEGTAGGDEGKAAATEAGLDFNALVEHYNLYGDLSEEHYAALSAIGADKAVVATYIKGQEAIAREQRSELFSDVGGESKATELLEWASSNLSTERVNELNVLLASNDNAVVRFALKTIHSERASSAEPALAKGAAVLTSTSSEGFKSDAEVNKAMADPRYGTDPTYTKMVEAKLLKSQLYR